MKANPITARQVDRLVYDVAGRAYDIDWAEMSERSLREVVRLLRDLDSDKRSAVRQMTRWPQVDD